MWNPLKKKFWIENEPERKIGMVPELGMGYGGCVRPRTMIHYDNDKLYYMSDAGLQEFKAPKPSRWKRAMETVENIVWWVGGLTFMVIVAVAIMLLSTMALIGKWVISIDLLTQLFR